MHATALILPEYVVVLFSLFHRVKYIALLLLLDVGWCRFDAVPVYFFASHILLQSFSVFQCSQFLLMRTCFLSSSHSCISVCVIVYCSQLFFSVFILVCCFYLKCGGQQHFKFHFFSPLSIYTRMMYIKTVTCMLYIPMRNCVSDSMIFDKK